MTTDWIPITECQHGFLYRLDSRNLCIGVYNVEQHGFIGVRTKFSDKYLFTEYHWDTGPPCGTAKPIELLCVCSLEPVEGAWRDGQWVDNTGLMLWLERQLMMTDESKISLICAWCKTWLHRGDESVTEDDHVSHGCCEGCVEKLYDELDRYNDES